jgi:hypothetical protein
MSYKSWELRREILADNDRFSEAGRTAALIFVEYVDWQTGEKVFTSKSHAINWFKHLAEIHGISDYQGLNGKTYPGWHVLKNTFDYLRMIGYASFDAKTKTLRLHKRDYKQDR